jgi:acetylornithine deacetylase
MTELNHFDWLARLVAFDTTSRNSNLALIDDVGAFLTEQGVPWRLTHNDDGTKANLYATIGPDIAGGVVLSGHSDVVPVDGQDWHTDPFQVVERDGLLYGRGTSDMKAFIACALAAVPRFTRLKLARPIHLAISYDEEVGCLGVHSMVADIVANLPKPTVVVVGEPTGMKVVNAHKSITSWYTTVHGHEEHSSNTHKGVNAIAIAADLIRFLGTMADDLRAKGDASHRFEPPYSTISVGTIHGGTAQNIVPRQCTFTWEYRLLPDEDGGQLKARFDAEVARVLPAMKAKAPEADIVTTLRAQAAGLRAVHGSPAEALVLALTGQNAGEAVSYATEAGIFQDQGLPAVICGPGYIREAHKPNEWIEVSQILECVAFLEKLGERLCTDLV